jgi:hypothetical protein
MGPAQFFKRGLEGISETRWQIRTFRRISDFSCAIGELFPESMCKMDREELLPEIIE